MSLNNNQFYQGDRSKVAPECPCGRNNKDGKFAPFKDDPKSGYCHSCGKTFHNNERPLIPQTWKPKPKNYVYIPDRYITESMKRDSDLHRYAQRLFPYSYKPIFDLYRIGGGDYNHTIYWQINVQQKACRAMSKHQHPVTGKGGNRFYLNKKYRERANLDGESPYCAFGEHLLANNGLPVIVVESQKTAVLMTIYDSFTKYKGKRIWIATCGCGNLERLIQSKVLDGRRVLLMPDADKKATEDWEQQAKNLGKNWVLSRDLYDRYGDVNGDIIDLIDQDDQFGVVLNPEGYPVIWG